MIYDTTPRMRGLPERYVYEMGDSRYNPAYAGTTDKLIQEE